MMSISPPVLRALHLEAEKGTKTSVIKHSGDKITRRTGHMGRGTGEAFMEKTVSEVS